MSEHYYEWQQEQDNSRTEDEADQPDPNPTQTAYERLMAHHERECTPAPGPSLAEVVMPMFQRIADLRRIA